ncbi:MAG: ABC transporter ATP-binding protein [Alphaproteobacteria bacterium]
MLIQLDKVTKRFGAVVVADGLDIALTDGEALGVLGPNGAGKSTMFNLITGGLRPDSGRIRFDGHDITGLKPHVRCRMGIGRSYQIPHPFAKMTVFENLLVGAAFGTGAAEREIHELCGQVLERTGLLDKANVPAGRLTLLERKRLELARALATRPRVLLLDEIAGGLTEGECRELVAAITAVRAEGVSIIWIEHVVHALLSVVDRLVVINFGRLLAEGAPDTVMADPKVREVYMGIAAE